ncbi:hypothetical protein BU23DRAFT_486664 [Bimuria novae-zelandiae CBS 107.79]|uniref:Velvet domain-containing protein n=1 Tax=Bimuria novae-zelandiae CBS 107.79 TaxID=1447943 RepID=A0A6A5UPS8_9PLEO|nr:hypothetical protein BU23DRAFT_486664 [Bimuria novae-zelandiae CBS 107.79]
MASTIAVTNETRSTSVRTTKDGRSIRYSLHVIQQPERARACGSGAKSSADRRPVDPPPIVELKVFEGDQDITFGYNANFFLFATLENARTIAPGRAPAASPSFPVLTGTPVAGMAYLDRPNPAGYFIFPDLSVRHEGKYRLSFALYEELKDPKDMDPEDRSGNARNQGGIDAHVSHRLEVKSAPFVVFSAKKFPGLSESTALSRMVAEQGCRVRIRRDVRMRRRENKPNKDWDEYDEDGGYEGGRRTSSTPDNYAQQQGLPTPNPTLDADNRPRSVSNASNTSFAAPRRQSMEEMAPAPAPAYQPTNSYQQMPPPQSTTYPQVPQYSAPQTTYQTQYAPPQPAAPLMQPPQAQYSQPSHQPTHNYQTQSNMHMGQSYGYMNNQSYQQSHYEQPAPARQEPAVDYNQPAPDYRRSSVTQPTQHTQQYPGPSQLMPSYGSMDYGRPQQMPQPIQPIQPIQPLHSPNHIAPVSSSSHSKSNGHALAPLRTVLADVNTQKLEPVSPSYQSPPNNMSAPMSATSEIAPHHKYLDTHKRSYSSTFDTRHLDDRLQQGARPNPQAPLYAYADNSVGSPDMEEPMDPAAMSYRRADGSHRSRRVPELGV